MNDPIHAENRLGTSLFDAVSYPDSAFSEMFQALASPREHWASLMDGFNSLGAEALHQRQERVRRMRHEDGATYNPFDTPSGKGIPWALEMIPLPITSGEWSALEAGLTQRAFLLERILADVYGPQTLLKEGILPAELIFANPSFLHPCHGIRPIGGRFLTFYAADLYRGKDGCFRVLRDYGASPCGLGYALENRIVMSRVYSELYQKTQIRRLAPFFNTFHRSLLEKVAIRREDPRIVLLSPGPDSRIYFEHAFLSRYLGYPLVESQDLTVRNGEVFLKKLAGLEPVEVIFRHIPDDGSDPFTLRKDAASGVAGLIQAFREERIDVVNPIGCGFIDTPVLPVFLPQLCRRLLAEDLSMENHPVVWCGHAAGRSQILEDLSRWTLAPAFDRTRKTICPADMAARIQVTPYAFMAQEPVEPSLAPGWTAHGMVSCYTLLRVFACATDQGFAVMPGGLAITAGKLETLMNGFPEAQESKDIWVLSDQPVEPFSMMSGLQSVAEVRRGNDLPSRVADHLLWLGRYLERAEGIVRTLRSVFRRLTGEANLEDLPELPFLLELLKSEHKILPAPQAGATSITREALDQNLHAVLYQPDRPDSVVAVLRQVREAARNVRDRLSPDSWRVIHRLDGFADRKAGDPLELLDDTLFALSAFSGLAMESMTRGLGWRFMDMGRRVERAIHQTGLIRTGIPWMNEESRSCLEALLEVSDSIMTYRARYRTTFQLAPVLDLLLIDESNPKSLAFQCSQLAVHVEHLPRADDRRFNTAEERLALEMLTAVRLLTVTCADGREGESNQVRLTDFLQSMEAWLMDFSQRICAHYLSRVPLTPHFSSIPGESSP